MKTSEYGIAFVKKFESLSLAAYKDTHGWAIGYGHVDPSITPGMTITDAQADAYLREDLEWNENVVNSFVKVALTQNQFDALVDFVHNVGSGAFTGSTMLKLLNDQDYAEAADEFVKWDKAGGKQLPGLTKRREAERLLFLS